MREWSKRVKKGLNEFNKSKVKEKKLKGGGGNSFWDNHVLNSTVGLKNKLRGLTAFNFYDIRSK